MQNMTRVAARLGAHTELCNSKVEIVSPRSAIRSVGDGSVSVGKCVSAQAVTSAVIEEYLSYHEL